VRSARSSRGRHPRCRPRPQREPVPEQDRQDEQLEPVERADLVEGADGPRPADQVNVAVGPAGPQSLGQRGRPDELIFAGANGKALNANAVLLDDYNARKLARAEGLQVRGTLGLLETLYLQGHITDLRDTFGHLLAHSYIDQRLLDLRLRALGLPSL